MFRAQNGSAAGLRICDRLMYVLNNLVSFAKNNTCKQRESISLTELLHFNLCTS